MEMQQFRYDNKIVRNFIYASLLFGVVGMSVGLLVALYYLFPKSLIQTSYFVKLPIYYILYVC